MARDDTIAAGVFPAQFFAFASLALAAAHGLSVPAPAPSSAERVAAVESSAPSPAPSFDKDVKPLLMKRCSPCHAPGGKLYEKLPFDDAKTVASHPPGIRKRLKGDDLKLYETWLAAQPK